MRAAVLTGEREPLAIEDVDRPEAGPGDVVVETEACGICRSDWHVWAGDWSWLGSEAREGQILGHEPAGTVVEVGEGVDHVSEGDHVAIPFNLADGTCPMCQDGMSHLCANGLGLGFSEEVPGAWAEEVRVPDAHINAIRTPDGVSSTDMAALGCRYMTAFHALAHRAEVRPGDWLAVHGCGGVGLSAVQIGSALGANVIAVDIMDEKLDRATDLGARATVNGADVGDVPGEVADITDGGADVSVDALGIEETCRNSVMSVRSAGKHVQIGISTAEEEGMIALPTDRMALQEIEFIGSKGMQPTRYGEIFRMIDGGKLDPGAVVSRTVGLGDVSDVLADMSEFKTTGMSVVTDF